MGAKRLATVISTRLKRSPAIKRRPSASLASSQSSSASSLTRLSGANSGVASYPYFMYSLVAGHIRLPNRR